MELTSAFETRLPLFSVALALDPEAEDEDIEVLADAIGDAVA